MGVMNRIIRSDDKFFEVVFLGLVDVGSGFCLFGGEDLVPFSGSALLDLPLQLLEGFTLGVAFGDDGEASEPELGLVLDQVLLVIVAEAEAGGTVTSEGSPEPVEHYVLGLPVVLGGNGFAEILLRHVGLPLVVHVQQQLTASQQLVDSQSPGLDGDRH